MRTSAWKDLEGSPVWRILRPKSMGHWGTHSFCNSSSRWFPRSLANDVQNWPNPMAFCIMLPSFRAVLMQPRHPRIKEEPHRRAVVKKQPVAPTVQGKLLKPTIVRGSTDLCWQYLACILQCFDTFVWPYGLDKNDISGATKISTPQTTPRITMILSGDASVWKPTQVRDGTGLMLWQKVVVSWMRWAESTGTLVEFFNQLVAIST